MVSVKERFDQATATRDTAALRAIFKEISDVPTLAQRTGLTTTQILPWATLANDIASVEACLQDGASVTPEVAANAHVACGLEAYRLLVPAGLDVNQDFGYGGTALTEAVMSNDEDLIRLLLNGGANPSIGSLNGSTALEVAVKESLPVSSIKLIADHDVEFPTKGLVSLAVLAGDLATLEYLVQNGANVNETTDDSFATEGHGKHLSALHLAVREGSVELVQLLLKHGADRSVKDVNGKTALDAADETGRTEIVELLRST